MGSCAFTLMKTQQLKTQRTPRMLCHLNCQADTQRGKQFSICFRCETKRAREDSQCSSQPTSLIACRYFWKCSPANTKLSNAGDDAGSCSVQCHGVLPAAPGARCPPQCYSRCCGPQQLHSMSASESFDSPACYLRPLAVVHLLNPLTVPAS